MLEKFYAGAARHDQRPKPKHVVRSCARVVHTCLHARACPDVTIPTPTKAQIAEAIAEAAEAKKA